MVGSFCQALEIIIRNSLNKRNNKTEKLSQATLHMSFFSNDLFQIFLSAMADKACTKLWRMVITPSTLSKDLW